MDALQILESPDYINANPATKRAIFDKHIASTPDYANANEATQGAIRQRFGLTEEKRSIELAAVPVHALVNAPASAAKFAGDIYAAVTSPVQTITGLADLAAGALRAGAKQVLPEAAFNFLDQIDNPETTRRISETASAAGGMLADRYGSYERIKRTVATDPVGALGDLSTLATGGALATARVAPGVSGALARTAASTDPLMLTARGAVGGVNALRQAAANVPSPIPMVNSMLAPYVDPGAVASASIVRAVEDPAAAAQALRATQNAFVTPGAPQLSASERMLEAGAPSLGLAALEQNLAKASPEAAQLALSREQQRVAAIQGQLARVDEQLRTQAGALAPAQAVELRQVRDSLMRQLADERQTLANTAQVVGQPLPEVSQARVGGAIQERGAKTEAAFAKETIRPAYKAAFAEDAPRPGIDIASPLDRAKQITGDISAIVDPTSVSPAVRNLMKLSPEGGGSRLVSLEDFQSIRSALGKQARMVAGTDRARAAALRSVIDEMDAALEASKIPEKAKTLFAEAQRLVLEEQLPRFRTGETGRMLSTTRFNMPGTLPSQQVASFLKNEEAAAQFVRTFQGDQPALQSMQQGVLDLYRRDIVDPTTRAVDPARAADFEVKYARQLDTLEAAGLNVRETMQMVQRDAAAVQQAFQTLTTEAKKFGKTKTADAVVDLALKSPMDMRFVRDRLSPTARQALTDELVLRATSALERGDAKAAVSYLTDNAKSLKVGLGKEGAKTYDELLNLARLQDEFLKVSAQAPKTDLVTPVKLAQAYTPQQLTDLQVVVNDIKRMRQVGEMGSSPGATAKTAATEAAVEAGAAPSRIPGWFSPTITAIRSAGRNILERMDRRATAAMIDLAIRDPDKLIPLLEEAAAKKQTVAKREPPRPLTIPGERFLRSAPVATAGALQQNQMNREENQNAMAR